MSQRSGGNSGGNNRLNRAVDYVGRMWFPSNPEVVKKIQQGFERGAYDLDIDFIIQDLKADFALFSLCVQRLVETLQKEGVPIEGFSNPFKILEWAGVDRIKQVLESANYNNSSHSMQNLAPDQVQRYEELVISCTTAELISERQQLESGWGFSAALLRQLGRTLVAWNYPQVYRKVISNLPPDLGLDAALEEALGFSPEVLTLALIESWGLHPDLEEAIVGSEVSSEKTSPGQGVPKASLLEICQIGEALARANHPDLFPQAAQDWNYSATQLAHFLGEDALNVVRERIKDYSRTFQKGTPQLFEVLNDLDPESRIHDFERQKGLKREAPSVAATAPWQQRLEKFSKWFESGAEQSAAVRALIAEVLMPSGCLGGAIFVINPLKQLLTPRLKFGNIQGLKVDDYAVGAQALLKSPITVAFACDTPFCENLDNRGAEKICYFCAGLGRTRRRGVLYLEFHSAAKEEHAVDLIAFRAIREAFHDVLKLD